MRAPATPAVARAFLVVTGLAFVVGGALHPFVPEASADKVRLLTSNVVWAPAHWLLTVAQCVAVAAVVLAHGALKRHAALRDAGLLTAGVALLAVAFTVGTLGTLSAATGLRAAAASGSVTAFETVDAFTLGLGWTCLLLAASGMALTGVALVTARASTRSRRAGGVLAAGGAAFAVAALALPPAHPWTHQFMLPGGAAAAGVGFLVLAFIVREA